MQRHIYIYIYMYCYFCTGTITTEAPTHLPETQAGTTVLTVRGAATARETGPIGVRVGAAVPPGATSSDARLAVCT